jgi:ankyrin repeat protein
MYTHLHLSTQFFFLLLLQNGHTLLFKAADKGYSEVVRVLLKAGADTEIKANVSRYAFNTKQMEPSENRFFESSLLSLAMH